MENIENQTQQRIKSLFSVLPLTVFTIVITLLKTEPAASYCIYNYSDEEITVTQTDSSGKGFWEVVEPGGDKCCNWSESTCTDSEDRGGKTNFHVHRGSHPDYTPDDEFIGEVETYNGGVVIYDGGSLRGCWAGRCQGQWINGDGSEGIPENIYDD